MNECRKDGKIWNYRTYQRINLIPIDFIFVNIREHG